MSVSLERQLYYLRPGPKECYPWNGDVTNTDGRRDIRPIVLEFHDRHCCSFRDFTGTPVTAASIYRVCVDIASVQRIGPVTVLIGPKLIRTILIGESDAH